MTFEEGEAVAKSEASSRDNDTEHSNFNAPQHGHDPYFLAAKIAGSSSISGRSLAVSFLAPAGTCRLKRSAAASVPVFQVLTSIVYWGAPATFWLVMT